MRWPSKLPFEHNMLNQKDAQAEVHVLENYVGCASFYLASSEGLISDKMSLGNTFDSHSVCLHLDVRQMYVECSGSTLNIR